MKIPKIEIAASLQHGRKGTEVRYIYEGSSAPDEFALLQLVIDVCDAVHNTKLERVTAAVRRELVLIEEEDLP